MSSTLRSTVPGIGWPAIPGPEGAMVLALVQQLEHSQWWTQDRMWAMQRRQLARLAAHAAATVPFYGDRLGALGAPGNPPASVEHWRELPILTREDIQEAGDALKSRNLGREHGKLSELVSSGSTGKPISAWSTSITSVFWKACTIREHLWHGRDFSQSIAGIRRAGFGEALYPEGNHGKNWGAATQGLIATGPGHLLNIVTHLSDQAEWLLRCKPGYLISFPTNLEFLARHCLDNGITFPGLLEVRGVGEVMRPEIVEVCRKAWDVPVSDIYSAMEMGHIAVQCPEHHHYHIVSERLLVEILDDAGQPCRPGEIGRVVITDLHNFGFPLIRYELGDYAEVGEPCPCGRGLPVLNRIVGRVRNMMTLPSGELVWPLFGYSGFTEIAPVRQIQYVQKAVSHIEVRLVVDHDLDAGQEKAIAALVVERLKRPVEVTFAYLDEIPRSAGGKFEDFMSEIPVDGRNRG